MSTTKQQTKMEMINEIQSVIAETKSYEEIYHAGNPSEKWMFYENYPEHHREYLCIIYHEGAECVNFDYWKGNNPKIKEIYKKYGIKCEMDECWSYIYRDCDEKEEKELEEAEAKEAAYTESITSSYGAVCFNCSVGVCENRCYEEAEAKAKEAEERLEKFWALEEAGQFESYICGSCSEELTPNEFYKGKMCCDNPLFGYDEKEEECIHDSRKRLRLNGPIGDGCGVHCLSHLDWDESWECECCACEGIYWKYE